MGSACCVIVPRCRAAPRPLLILGVLRRGSLHYTLSSTRSDRAERLDVVSSSPRVTRTSVPVSARLFERSSSVIPGGVNSPVRAFKSVGGTPRFIASANGYTLIDADGHDYVDLVCSWGPMILGHAHPAVGEAAQ